MRLKILGTEYECRHLTKPDQLRWYLQLHYECENTFYSDLYERVENLPAAAQEAVFRTQSPPKAIRFGSTLYYKLATRPRVLGDLLCLIIPGEDLVPKVTKSNAMEILLAVSPFIGKAPPPMVTDTEEKQQAAQDTFDKLEKTDAEQ